MLVVAAVVAGVVVLLVWGLLAQLAHSPRNGAAPDNARDWRWSGLFVFSVFSVSECP